MNNWIQHSGRYRRACGLILSSMIGLVTISCPIAVASTLHQSDETKPDSSIPLPVRIGTMLATFQPDPVYPPSAIAGHLQGPVALVIVISAQGDVVRIVSADGPPLLAKSAREAVQQWKFKPYLLNGKPTDVQTVVAVYYDLDQPDNPTTSSSTQKVPYRIGGSVLPPTLIYAVDLKFSPQAREQKIGGIVLVGMMLDEEGKPQYVHVVRGIGMGLDENAVEAVKQYRFKPATMNGKPVRVSLNMEVNFVMK